jgi:hypothetical protein
MPIAWKQTVNPTPLQRLAADLSFRFAKVLRQNNLGGWGMDHRSIESYRRRLVDRGVRFVIGSLGEVGLRDGGD